MNDNDTAEFIVDVKRTGVDDKTLLENSFVGNEVTIIDYINTIRILSNEFGFSDDIYLRIVVFFKGSCKDDSKFEKLEVEG